MNDPKTTPFDELLAQYSAAAQTPVPVPEGFAGRVAAARDREVSRAAMFRRITAALVSLSVFLFFLLSLQPKLVTPVEERATRQTMELPESVSNWSVDVAKLTIPTKGLFTTMPKVTLPETPVLPKLGAVPQAAVNSLDPLTSGPRRTLTLFLRDTGFGTH
jgi:hypothetical protein